VSECWDNSKGSKLYVWTAQVPLPARAPLCRILGKPVTQAKYTAIHRILHLWTCNFG